VSPGISEDVIVEGYRGAPLQLVLRADDDVGRTALVLPGRVTRQGRRGGSPSRPDLAYTAATLELERFAVLEVWWDVDTAPVDDIEGWLLASASAGVEAAATGGRRLELVVGRSLGTRALALLSARGLLGDLATVWLAPLVHYPEVREALLAHASSAFVVGGSEDAAFDLETAELLAAQGAEVEVIEGGDHGFQLEDPAASARALAGVLDRLRLFARRV
jgi:pimeloyl-ACP methyl ester carboxylesterase